MCLHRQKRVYFCALKILSQNTVTRDQLRLKIIGHNVMEEKTPILRGKPLVVFELPSRPPQNRLEADGNCTKTCEGDNSGNNRANQEIFERKPHTERVVGNMSKVPGSVANRQIEHANIIPEPHHR